MTRYGMGRLVAPDERDRQFPMGLALAQTEPVPETKKIWTPGPVLDQGQTPMCVGFGWRQFLNTDPPGDTSETPAPSDIYASAQQDDEWGTTPHDGSTVRAGAKALSDESLLASYLWAQHLGDLSAWLLARGPVVFGTNWYEAMFTPDAAGVAHVGGAVAGGHCYLCIGFDAELQMFRCINSWGASWGDNGQFSLSSADVQRLVFDEDGEACTAVETPVVSQVEDESLERAHA